MFQSQVCLKSTNLTNRSFILIQVVSELLQLQLSLPQLVLQVPHHPLITLHRARGAPARPAVRQRLSSATYGARACTLTGRWTPAVRVGVSVSADRRSALHGFQVAGRGLSWSLSVAGAAVRWQAGEGVASRVGQLTRLVASSGAVTDPAVQAAFLRGGGGRHLSVGGAEQVQVVLAFWYIGTVARGEVLHGGTALGNDGFEGSGPQYCFLHVLEKECKMGWVRQVSKDLQKVLLNSR